MWICLLYEPIFGMRSDSRPELNKGNKKTVLMREFLFFRSEIWLFLTIQVLITLNCIHGQFYNIYPAADIVPNTLPLNSSIIQLGAFLSLTALDGTIRVSRSSFEVICIECQKNYINSDSNVLSNIKLEILYYDTSVVNTSKASIAALEFSLTTNHIASFGKILFKELFLFLYYRT